MNLYAASLLFSAAIFSIAFLASRRSGRISVIDLAWGMGFVISDWLVFWFFSPKTAANWVVLLLITLWGVRLTAHLHLRNPGKSEDSRYEALKTKHPSPFGRFTRVFLPQALLQWTIGLVSVRLIAFPGIGTGPIFWAGCGLFLAGFFFEAVSDHQMQAYRKNPANRGILMTRGLRRYSRHPNYFGELLMWWALFLIAAAAGAYWTILSPLAITFLLLKVSGIPVLEKSFASRPGWQEYAKKTSKLIPLPPKK